MTFWYRKTDGHAARNVILMSLVIDEADGTTTKEELWDIYYHLYLDASTLTVLVQQVNKLLPHLESVQAWNGSQYGAALWFCDRDTLEDVKRHCRRIVADATANQTNTLKGTLEKNLKASKTFREQAMVLSGARSAAPLSMQSKMDIPESFRKYWADGTVTPGNDEATVPNPMFASLISDHCLLHYANDPLMGYHLATAFAQLSDASPLRFDEPSPTFRAAEAARTQFNAWTNAFRTKCEAGEIVVRLAVADIFAFCHTMQHISQTGETCANWYRRQWDSKPLALDADVYGHGGKGGSSFDVIDTSNLADHVGALNVLASAVPLLSAKPWATINTELLLKQHLGSQQTLLDGLLCGDAVTMSLLLGVTPVQFWANAKCESHVDEVYLGLTGQPSPSGRSQLHMRLVWKPDNRISGQFDGRPAVQIQAKALAGILFQVYLKMFEGEAVGHYPKVLQKGGNIWYLHFHRGTFASFLKFLKHRIATDWTDVCDTLMDFIVRDRTLGLASNQMQDLLTQLHVMDVARQPLLECGIQSNVQEGPLKSWRKLPTTVSVTVVVPRAAIEPLYTGSGPREKASPTIIGTLGAGPNATEQWLNWFTDLHIVFGNARRLSRQCAEDVEVIIDEDATGWGGASSLIATFVAPTEMLQTEPASALAGIYLPPVGQNLLAYADFLRESMSIFEARLDDHARVLISRNPPGLGGNRIVGGGTKSCAPSVEMKSEETTMSLHADTASRETRVKTLTGHLKITGAKGHRLLQEKAAISLRQRSPFVLEIVFGEDELTYRLPYPVPITTVNARTRIARVSSYVEVIAPVAKPLLSGSLEDYFLPSILCPPGLPVAMNAPYINLDGLPVINMERKGDLSWLTTLTSFMFSPRERALRGQAVASGLSPSTRVNFKESLFTIFMLSSGLQGGQTGLFAIQHPERGGIHMLLFVSALRVDGDTASVVLDAAVLPLTTKLVTSGAIEDFLLTIQSLECGSITVNDEELAFWKKCLPTMAERCRTWKHKPECEYRRRGATIPLSLELGQQLLCSCGSGMMPNGFVSMPEWDTVVPHATRIAISPMYVVPLVEEVADVSGLGAIGDAEERCRSCGRTSGRDGGGLKKCVRCRKTKYCCRECQKKDWKTHRMECDEVAQGG